MMIDFPMSRWNELKEIYEKWWNKELDRPIISIVSQKDTAGIDPFPNIPVLSQSTCHDLSVSAEDIIGKLDYDLSKKIFLGDSFPRVNLECFGPGSAAAFLGCRLDNSSGNVWFYPPDNAPEDIKDIHITYDPNNMWLKRVKDICAAGVKKWNGHVNIGMPDLGGTMDILASFRTTEELLFDLYDNEDEVVRLINEIHECWFKLYDEINEILQPNNSGYCDWSGILSQKPSYILQCDFSYMLGNDMFKKFALDEIRRSCKRLPRAFFHLDGINCLQNLPSLLEIDELDAVQWVSGDGQPGCGEWGNVYKQIRDADKNVYFFGDLSVPDKIKAELGSIKGFAYIGYVNENGIKEAEELIKRHS